MQVHASADLPLAAQGLGEALREFAAFAHSHLQPIAGASLRIALAESGLRLAEAAARALPADVRSFGIGLGPMPGRELLTGPAFLEAVAENRPQRTYMQLATEDATQFETAWEALSRGGGRAGVRAWRHIVRPPGRLADTREPGQPAGGRHVLPLPEGRAEDGREPRGAFRRGQPAGPRGECYDRARRRAARSASGKADEQPGDCCRPPAADPRLRPPTPEARIVVQAVFREVLVRAAVEIGARPEDLRQVPLLFTKSLGFDKRMSDVSAGRKRSTNFPSRLRRFMKKRFPGYVFDAADPEQIWFRKHGGRTLDLLLMFDRPHQWGLGKTFSIAWGTDFPNTGLGGAHAGVGGTRLSIFWLFHQGWEQQVWAYTTAEELETALAGCQRLLQRVLPALEEQAAKLLVPVPARIPAGFPQLGAITAREAYEHTRSLAHAWAPDARCESISAAGSLAIRDHSGSGVDAGGRILRHGHWLVKFVSARSLQHVLYEVPHTGTPWWNFHSVIRTVHPHLPPELDTGGWVDSSRIAPLAFAEVEARLGKLRVLDLFLSLQHREGRFVWQAHCIAVGDAPNERRDIVVQFDPHSAEFIKG